jgi:tetratricopeptide (TPR) repeat protein
MITCKELYKGMRCVALALLCSACALSQTAADPLAEARSKLDAGMIHEPEALLRNYLNANPSSADAHFLLGYALFRDQKPKESLEELTAGARFRHPHADELKIVAGDYVMLADYSDADKWFTQVVSETPNDADAWYLLGRTKYNENEYAAAISSFEHVLTLHPKHVEAENNVGLSWKELNDHDRARDAFQAAIQWQGDAPTDAQPFLNLGTLLVDDHKDTDALPYLQKAVALSSGNPTAHEELGKAYLDLNNLADAQSELEKAIALAPEVSALHYKLAQILRKAGSIDRSKKEFALCEKLNGAHSSAKTPNPPPLNIAEPK